ncbi:unnamed protein product [Calypogeia fissa]
MARTMSLEVLRRRTLVSRLRELSRLDSLSQGTLQSLSIDPGVGTGEDGEDDSVEDILKENELDQVPQLVPRDELKNFDLKQAWDFLAKEIPVSPRESAVQPSEENVLVSCNVTYYKSDLLLYLTIVHVTFRKCTELSTAYQNCLLWLFF